MRVTIFCVFILFCVTSCTNTTRVGYGFLDWYLLHKVERFVSLNKPQKKSTKTALKGFHQWHRDTQLPLYTQFIGNLNGRLQQGPITGTEIHALTDEVQLLLDNSLSKILTPVAKVLHTLSDAQVAEVIQNLEEERQEYIEDYVTVSNKTRIKRHRKELTRFMKRLIGAPNKTQKQQIAQWAKALEPFEKLNAQQQKMWQKDIGNLLKDRQDLAKLTAGLGELMFYRTDNWAPELEAILDRNQEQTYSLIAQLINELDTAQRAKMITRLANYSKDFDHLHNKG